MNALRTIAVACCTLALTACVTNYRQPLHESSASLTLEHKNAINPSDTRITAFNNSRCIRDRGYGRLAKLGRGLLVSSDAVTTQVLADETLYLVFQGYSKGYNEGKYTLHSCVNLVSFEPQEKASYTAYQEISISGSCKVVIKDKTTNKTVESFKSYDTPSYCVDKHLY